MWVKLYSQGRKLLLQAQGSCGRWDYLWTWQAGYLRRGSLSGESLLLLPSFTIVSVSLSGASLCSSWPFIIIPEKCIHSVSEVLRNVLTAFICLSLEVKQKMPTLSFPWQLLPWLPRLPRFRFSHETDPTFGHFFFLALIIMVYSY